MCQIGQLHHPNVSPTWRPGRPESKMGAASLRHAAAREWLRGGAPPSIQPSYYGVASRSGRPSSYRRPPQSLCCYGRAGVPTLSPTLASGSAALFRFWYYLPWSVPGRTCAQPPGAGLSPSSIMVRSASLSGCRGLATIMASLGLTSDEVS